MQLLITETNFKRSVSTTMLFLTTAVLILLFAGAMQITLSAQIVIPAKLYTVSDNTLIEDGAITLSKDGEQESSMEKSASVYVPKPPPGYE